MPYQANRLREYLISECGNWRMFSQELVNAFIYVIDVAEGDKIPRKGGPAIQYSDLMIINKTELAPYVGADLDVMDRESKRMRGSARFSFATLNPAKGFQTCAIGLKKKRFSTEN